MIIYWDSGLSKIVFPGWRSESVDGTATPSTHPTEYGSPITDHVEVMNTKGSVDVVLSNTPLSPNEYGGAYQEMAFTGIGVVTFEKKYTVKVPKYVATPGPFEVGGVVGSIANLLSSPDFDITGTATRLETKEYKSRSLQWPADFDLCRDVLDRLEELRVKRTLVDIVISFRTIANAVITKVSPVRNQESGGKALFLTIAYEQIQIVNTERVAAPAATEPRAKGKTAKGPQGADTPGQQQTASSFLYNLSNGKFSFPTFLGWVKK